MEESIKKNLIEKLNPIFLEVKNNSHLHSGHAGDNGTGETHFSVVISSEKLENISVVAAHRMVNSALKDEFLKGLHALEIKVIK